MIDCFELLSSGILDGFNYDIDTLCDNMSKCVWDYDTPTHTRNIPSTRRV